MNRFWKTTVLATALAATTLTALPAAEARDRWHHHHNGDAIAAGVAGLALGAIVGGLASSNERQYVDPEPEYVYRDPPPRPRPHRTYYVEPAYVEPPEVVYYRSAEPWSREWYRYCESRYRSFDSRTGTFIGNDGAEHFCVAN